MISIAVSGMATNMPVTPQSAPQTKSDEDGDEQADVERRPGEPRQARCCRSRTARAPTPASTTSVGPSAWNCRSAKTAGSTVPRIEPMVGMKLRKKIVVGEEAGVLDPDGQQHQRS